MKPLRTSLLACAIAAFAGTAFASSGSLVYFKPRVMPVVVQVNAQGKVTDILPSEQLRPQTRNLLMKQLDAWIAKPATVKGKPVASTFIAEVAMRATPRKDGKYDVSFLYVKSLPMPFGGSVYWDNINGGLELALVSDNSATPVHHWVVPPVSERAIWMSAAQSAPTRVGGIRTASTNIHQVQPGSLATGQVRAMPAIVAAPQTFSGNAAARASGAPRTERP